ncbi:YqzK family protein [Bacillus carboniphilus]|uniref:YqzK family protein n=1 Tax=Bacillus carboniphilus TaxID=86663 RepID=A0ABY9JWQ6_9BACI|nr:YqzK family protein [Bacillus carboniphilus]WLR43809.1 YqzK family protein [Bacillus carboniphilus]
MRAIFDMIKVFVLFTSFTILFYYAIIWVNEEYQHFHRYDEPEGSALKVVSMNNGQTYSIKERLIFFYLNGE